MVSKVKKNGLLAGIFFLGLIMLISSNSYGFRGLGNSRYHYRGYGFGMHRMCPLGIWKNQSLIADLKLTQEQVQKIKDEYFKTREKMMSFKNQLDKIHLQMEKAFNSYPLDTKLLKDLVAKAAEIKKQMQFAKIDSCAFLQGILTKEQFQKLINRSHPRFGMRRKMGPRHRGEGKNSSMNGMNR